MDKIIRQFGQFRKAEENSRVIPFIFNSSAPDRHKTVLNQENWDLKNFEKNGIAGYMHDVYGGFFGGGDPDDVIGKARAWVEDNTLMGEIEFEPPEINEKADKIFRKINFGSLNAVSVGFIEKGDGHRGNEDDGEDPELYYFHGQELIEISVVPIPSNPEALAQRSFEPKEAIINDLTERVKKSINMPEEKVVDQKVSETSKVEVEMKGLDEFTKNLADTATKLSETAERLGKIEIPGPPAPDLSEGDKKDIGRYSIVKAIRQQMQMKIGEGKGIDGIELEMHQEGVKEMERSGLSHQGLTIPSLIFNPEKRADLKATVNAAGGYTVATDMYGLIETLKNRMVVIQAGGQLLTGLEGNFAAPRQASDSAATWRSEGGVATQSDPTFEQLTMTPKRLTTYTEYTNQFLRQSSIDVDRMVENTLYYAIANALETAVFTGSGSSNQPTGLFASSINNGDHGSNGTVFNWANVVQLETMVATDNALGMNMAYITNPTVAGLAKQTLKTTYQGGFIWDLLSSPVAPMGTINGYPAFSTNVISNALTRGTGTGLSALVFGNWSEVLIGQWGAIDLLVNPYSLDTYGTVRVVIAGYYDIGIRHLASFAAIEGLET